MELASIDTCELKHLDAQHKLRLMTQYHKWALDYLGNNWGKKIWDAGAGIGIVAQTLLETNPETIFLTEFTNTNLTILREKFANNNNVYIQFCDLNSTQPHELIDTQFDTALLLDVLEHIKDEDAALSLMYDKLAPRGTLLIKVPAHPSLYCDIDRASLHYRRYSKKSLRHRLIKNGFTITKLNFMNLPGALTYLLKGKVLRKTTNFSMTFSDKKLTRMNSAIPLIKRAENIIPPPFGLSIIAKATKLS